MSFLADENFPRPALEALRQAGFGVAWISEGHSGAAGEDVLARSSAGAATIAVAAIGSHANWSRHFSVVAVALSASQLPSAA
jgi:hypothetical protein